MTRQASNRRESTPVIEPTAVPKIDLRAYGGLRYSSSTPTPSRGARTLACRGATPGDITAPKTGRPTLVFMAVLRMPRDHRNGTPPIDRPIQGRRCRASVVEPADERCRRHERGREKKAGKLGSGRSAARARGRYRCFLPDLTGFTTSRCTEPEAQPSCYHSARGRLIPRRYTVLDFFFSR